MILTIGALLLLVVAFFLLRDWGSSVRTGSAGDAGAVAGSAQTPLLDKNGKPVVPWFRRSEGDAGPVAPNGTLALEGQVVDAAEAPVAGAQVFLDAYPPKSVTSGEDGGFSFEGLPPGTYRVSARKGDQVSPMVERELHESSAPVVLRMAVGGRVYVEVVTAVGEKPVVGAEVSTDRGHQEVTDAQGLAILRGARGSLRLWVRAPKFASLNTMVTLPDSPNAEERVRVTMIEGAPLSGKVVDEKGTPVPNARVFSQNPLELFEQAHGADAILSNEQGKFSFEVVPAGTYEFVAEHPDFAAGTSGPLKTDGKTSPPVTIVLSSGATISGSVVDDAGAGVPGALVRVQAEAMNSKPSMGDMREAEAGPDGKFEVRGLSKKPMRVAAGNAEGSSEPVSVDLSNGSVQGVVVKLRGSSDMAGMVVDASGQPVPDVKVVASGNGEDQGMHGFGEATTDGGGAFVIKPLSAGPYQVGVEKAPGELRSQVTAQAGDKNVRIVVKADGAITGRVQIAGGGAPKAFSVELNLPPGKMFSEGKGSFQLDDVAEGTYDLVLRSGEFSEKAVSDVRVVTGQKTDVGVITVERGRTISGRVLDSSGKPVAGALVVCGREIFGDGGAMVARAMGRAAEDQLGLRADRSEADGSFEIVGVPDSAMVLSAEHESAGRSMPVDVPSGTANGRFDLRMQAQGTVVGRVTQNGKPAPGVRVMATHENSSKQFSSVISGSDGSFRFERLSQGPTVLTAVESGASSSNVTSQRVNVGATAGPPVELDLKKGSVTLLVQITSSGGPIGSAEVFAFSGRVSPRTNGEIQEQMLKATGPGKVGDARGGRPARITGLLPGPISVCTVPVEGDPQQDLRIQRRLEEDKNVPAVCQSFDVAEAPEQQTMTMQVKPTRLAN